MSEVDLKSALSQIRELQAEGSTAEATNRILNLFSGLHGERKYKKVAELFKSNLCNPKFDFYTFEVAYALEENSNHDLAEEIYQYLLEREPSNSAVLNNLYVIKKNKGKNKEAARLIKKAYKLNPDETISRNYREFMKYIEEQDIINSTFKDALTSLKEENSFVIGKLSNFIANASKDENYDQGKMPIPYWKYKVLIGADDQKARSLFDQWLKKGYVRKTRDRNEYNTIIYEINPLIKEAIAKLEDSKINDKWIRGFENINAENLERLNYFTLLAKINKINKKYKAILARDFNELVFNYLHANEKSTVVLAGSLVEGAIIYYCAKKSIKQVTMTRGGNTIKKPLSECDLGDLLTFFEQNNIQSHIFVHIGNIARIYRNYIHPGKELREKDGLNKAKCDMCFLGAIEILKRLL